MTPHAWLLATALLGAGEAPLPPDHPPIDGPNAVQRPAPAPASDPTLMKELEKLGDLSRKDKAFEVASGAGKLFYTRGRFAEASRFLTEAVEKAAPTRALFLAERKKAGQAALPDAGSVGCASEGGKATLDALHEKAQAHAQAGAAPAAAACARAALEPALDTAELAAGAAVLTQQPDTALGLLDQVLEVEPARRSSLYLRGMARFDAHPDDVKALALAKRDLTQYLALSPPKERAAAVQRVVARIDAAVPEGGVSALDRKLAKERKLTVQRPMGLPPALAAEAARHPPMGANVPPAGAPGVAPLSPEMVEAVQNTERTPELDAGLAKLVEEGEEHLARGRFQEALDAYKRVVPFQPENGRAKAGMAWSLVGLGKPTADRVWRVAVQGDPSAVDKLGESLKKKGDEKGAKAVWKKLAETSPSYASQAGLSLKLR